MDAQNLWYVLPWIPFLTRGILCLVFWRQMGDELPEAALDREEHRSVILALAGFSFTGFAAVCVVDATTHLNLYFSTYYLLVSFLAYFSALDFQGWKHLRWHDQFATALVESANFGCTEPFF